MPYIIGVIWISFSQWLYAYDLGISVLNTGEYFSFYGLDKQYDQTVLHFNHEAINPNDIGGVTCVMLPVLYLVYVYRIINRKLLIIIFIYLNITMYYTGQKTAMLPIAIFDIFILYYHLKYNYNIYFKIVLLSTSISVIYYGDYIINIITRIISRFARIGSITSRLDFKLKAYEIFMDYPIIGAGHDSFLIHVGKNDPHDWNIQVLSDTGIIGFIIYCLILIYLFKSINKLKYKTYILWFIVYITLTVAVGTNFSGHTFWAAIAILGSICNKQKYRILSGQNKICDLGIM